LTDSIDYRTIRFSHNRPNPTLAPDQTIAQMWSNGVQYAEPKCASKHRVNRNIFFVVCGCSEKEEEERQQEFSSS